MQSLNFLVDSFGLGPFSIDQILAILKDHGLPCSGRENALAMQKFINKIISMSEKKGGDVIYACLRVVKAAVESSVLAELEGCVLRCLDFSKSVVMYCGNISAKADCSCVYDA